MFVLKSYEKLRDDVHRAGLNPQRIHAQAEARFLRRDPAVICLPGRRGKGLSSSLLHWVFVSHK